MVANHSKKDSASCCAKWITRAKASKSHRHTVESLFMIFSPDLKAS